MIAHILPDVVAADFERLLYTTELRDSSGRMLGYFIPAYDPEKYEIIDPELTEDELRQIEASGEWYSTDEVLRHLESLK